MMIYTNLHTASGSGLKLLIDGEPVPPVKKQI